MAVAETFWQPMINVRGDWVITSSTTWTTTWVGHQYAAWACRDHRKMAGKYPRRGKNSWGSFTRVNAIVSLDLFVIIMPKAKKGRSSNAGIAPAMPYSMGGKKEESVRGQAQSSNNLIAPNTAIGQHFLKNPAVVNSIVQKSGVKVRFEAGLCLPLRYI
jgi:hypothetical protein